jgi:hypothetical protein
MSEEPGSVLEVLEQARKLLVEVGWTQHAFARNSRGHILESNDPTAVCYCALGAVFYISPSGSPLAGAAYKRLNAVIDGRDIVRWNDSPERKKEDVLEVYDKAIAQEMLP